MSHESDGHLEMDYAAPGEYSDITTLITNGVITEIEKVRIAEITFCWAHLALIDLFYP